MVEVACEVVVEGDGVKMIPWSGLPIRWDGWWCHEPKKGAGLEKDNTIYDVCFINTYHTSVLQLRFGR